MNMNTNRAKNLILKGNDTVCKANKPLDLLLNR